MEVDPTDVLGRLRNLALNDLIVSLPIVRKAINSEFLSVSQWEWERTNKPESKMSFLSGCFNLT